jgi:hypothetical protein
MKRPARLPPAGGHHLEHVIVIGAAQNSPAVTGVPSISRYQFDCGPTGDAGRPLLCCSTDPAGESASDHHSGPITDGGGNRLIRPSEPTIARWFASRCAVHVGRKCRGARRTAARNRVAGRSSSGPEAEITRPETTRALAPGLVGLIVAST